MTTNNSSLEATHQLHVRQGRKRADCSLCWREYHRHRLTIPRLPMVPYSYETVYQLAPGKVIVDEWWHPRVIASVEKQYPGRDYGVQYAVRFEDDEQRTYQLQELIYFLNVDLDQVLAVYEQMARRDALADAAMLERSYEEADIARQVSAHLDRYQQRLKRSEVESDRVYYQTYLEAWTSHFSECQGATNG